MLFEAITKKVHVERDIIVNVKPIAYFLVEDKKVRCPNCSYVDRDAQPEEGKKVKCRLCGSEGILKVGKEVNASLKQKVLGFKSAYRPS